MTPRRSSADSAFPDGFSLIELCVVMVVLGILFVMGAALLSNARRNGNEASAIGSLRAVNTAQFAYLNGCGAGQYATTFVILGTKQPQEPGGYLAPDLAASASPQRNGYQFVMTQGQSVGGGAVDCMGRTTQSAYYASAAPLVYGNTGIRSFGTNQVGAIWQVDSSMPPAEPFGPPARLAE